MERLRKRECAGRIVPRSARPSILFSGIEKQQHVRFATRPPRQGSRDVQPSPGLVQHGGIIPLRANWRAAVVRELTYETRGAEGSPSSMLGRLLTSQPIRIEDGCDVGGRREEDEKRSARTRAGGGAPGGSSWALLFVARK
ncbi:hypothetical protein NDU88_007068 [Pleurodeles waltl]|uniref:Uncharacterized protein n=1 Tax=Pleurodeles waltl TaxID=8319 RepID=A0AAV7U178_PLEWA|nr:hypothetical protein NDU88_007068 [Pleurodeles waltl]